MGIIELITRISRRASNDVVPAASSTPKDSVNTRTSSEVIQSTRTQSSPSCEATSSGNTFDDEVEGEAIVTQSNEGEQSSASTSSVSRYRAALSRSSSSASKDGTHSLQVKAHPNRKKGEKTISNTSELKVDELHPALITPKCKPNDLTLLYRDISDLASTGVINWLCVVLCLVELFFCVDAFLILSLLLP